MTFAEYIKEKRERAGKAQQEVSRELGLSASTVNKWEKGISLPRTDLHLKVAKYFRMTQQEVSEYLSSSLVLDSNELADKGNRLIKIVHATTELNDSSVINEMVESIIKEMSIAGWLVYSASTALAVYDRVLSKRTVQWCTTLVFER